MRKFLFLSTLMLAFGLSSALGALPTAELQVSTTGNEKTFYIKSNATYSNNGRYFLNSTTGVATEIADYGKFAFYAVDGVADAYYIKECTTNKWLSYDNTAINSGKDFVTLVDAQENYFNVTKNNLYYWIRPVNSSGSATNYCNWNGGPTTYGATNTLGLYNNSEDKGSQWIFVESENVVTSLEAISNSKCYTLTAARGGIFPNGNGTNIVPNQNAAASTVAGADKWALLTYQGSSYYLYNLNTQKFLKGDGSLGALPDQAFTLSKMTSPIGVFQFMLKYGSNTLNHNGTDFVINSWGSADDGNIIMICEAGTFDASDMDALITNAAALEFAAKKSGILTKIAPLSFLTTYSTVVANINAATTEAELNTALSGINNFITIRNYQNSSNYLEIGNPNASYNSSPSDYSNYIQLVSAGNGEFYLKGYKSQRYIGDVATSTQITTDATPTTSFYIQQNSNGRYILRPAKYGAFSDQSGYHYIHNNGCVGWDASANNSQHFLVEVADPDAEVNVTYALYYLNNKIAEEVALSGIGLKATAPTSFIRDFVTLACEDVTITAANQTVRVDATWAGPFDLYADYASITKWYDMSVRDTWYVTSDSKDGDAPKIPVAPRDEH